MASPLVPRPTVPPQAAPNAAPYAPKAISLALQKLIASVSKRKLPAKGQYEP